MLVKNFGFTIKSISFFFIITLLLIQTGCSPRKEYVNVTFRVHAVLPADDTVYIAGNTEQLGMWYPNKVPLTRLDDSSWQTTIRLRKGRIVDYKFTLGDWVREQTDEYGNISINKQVLPLSDTSVHHTIRGWRVERDKASLRLDEYSIFYNSSPVVLNYHWRYTGNDSSHFAERNFDDSHWVLSDGYLFERAAETKSWDGLGWFRLHLWVDSSLWGKTVAFTMRQMGASEIYFNGEKQYTFGVVSKDPQTFEPVQNRKYYPLQLDTTYHQVFAIKYAAPHFKQLQSKEVDPGFIIYISDLATELRNQGEQAASRVYYQQLFTLLPFVMAVFHLILFGFFPQFKENLFYAVCLLGYAGLIFFYDRVYQETDIYAIFFSIKAVMVSNIISQFFGLLTMYVILRPEKFGRAWFFGIAGAGILLAAILFSNRPLNYFTLTFLILCLLEVIYLIFTSTMRDKNAWLIMVAGLGTFIFFVCWQLLIDFGFIEHPGGYYLIVNYGFLALMISMSAYLSYNFARLNRDLSLQLKEINLLTEEKIKKEREAVIAESKQRLLSAEFIRKTSELEEARKLQLSMLPAELPDLMHYQPMVQMKTAAEVGGDYYDLKKYSDQDIYMVIGDATGHGAKAGIMVTITKSLLAVLDLRKGLINTIIQLNKSIKSLNLHNLYMSLIIAELAADGIRYISAGMPPVYVYRKSLKKAEMVISKSMPLGAFANFEYTIQKIDLEPGDICVFVTDGLTELFNIDREILGIERTRELVEHILEKYPVSEFSAQLFKEVENWGSGEINDDITVLLLEYRGNESVFHQN